MTLVGFALFGKRLVSAALKQICSATSSLLCVVTSKEKSLILTMVIRCYLHFRIESDYADDISHVTGFTSGFASYTQPSTDKEKLEPPTTDQVKSCMW